MNFGIWRRSSPLNWAKGFAPINIWPRGGQVHQAAAGKTLVWKDQYLDSYHIGDDWNSDPTQIGNVLYIKTRENQILRSRESHSAHVSTGVSSKLLKSDQQISENEEGLRRGFASLKIALGQLNGSTEGVTASFAANALFCLEKHGHRDTNVYENQLYPALSQKYQYLDTSGLSGAIWAISRQDQIDESLLSNLLTEAKTRHFGDQIQTLSGVRF